ncbi:MAG: tripartite tricarboxylate transporter substrate binding protein, partial [Betaproteobacteria bacterium]
MQSARAFKRFVRNLSLTALAAVTLSVTMHSAHAQAAWPTKPIRVVVPFAPGSFTDTAARTVGAELSA